LFATATSEMDNEEVKAAAKTLAELKNVVNRIVDDDDDDDADVNKG